MGQCGEDSYDDTMKTWSGKWKASIKPRKQRKYRFEAPLHIKGHFLSAHLSNELRVKHKMRSIRVVTGDKIRVMRGNYKGKMGKVEGVNVKDSTVRVQGIEVQKKDGSIAHRWIHASNIMITEMKTDRKRLA